MSYIETVPEDEAVGDLAAIYQALHDTLGYVPNYGRQFSHRPDVFQAWAQLNSAIKTTMDPRRYELAPWRRLCEEGRATAPSRTPRNSSGWAPHPTR